MSSKVGLQLSSLLARSSRTRFRRSLGRRYQTTGAAAASSEGALSRIWNSPVGIKTVHFWAPVMKWAIVLAGASDFARPAENLSLTQNLALTSTGLIWTRWCFVIKPKNMLLAAVNFLLAGVGVTQLSRIFLYQRSLKNRTLPQVAEQDVKDIADTAKDVAKDPQGAAQRAEIR